MTAIIILNWNNANDTIHCLSSLTKAAGEFCVYVVDNGSTDDSLQRINEWVENNRSIKVLVIPLDKNYGFAVGNNKGIAIASGSNPDSYLLLNNDTEVCPDFLVSLDDFAKKHPQYKVLTPLIHLFYDKEKIWNAGGRIKWGFRKYYYAGQKREDIKEKEFLNISFITGCALYFLPSVLNNKGEIFTERFFFGEEDFEFSLRMAKNNVPMACVLSSKIYHKVGTSIDAKKLPGKTYIYYLNRFINVRKHYGKFFYLLWSLLYKSYIKRTLEKNGCPKVYISKFVESIYRDAKVRESVSAEDFKTALAKGWNGKMKTEKKRIMILSDSSSDHTKRWVKSIADRGNVVALFSLNIQDSDYYHNLGNVKLYAYDVYGRLKDKRKNGAFEKINYLKTILKLRHHISEFEPDIVHAHYATSYGMLGVLSGFRPLIISLWGSDAYLFPKVSCIHREILKFNLSKADKILSTSHCMAQEVAQYTDKEITVTPFGVDIDKFAYKRIEKQDDEIIIGTVKTLLYIYGLDVLIDAFSIVVRNNPTLNLRLYIAGDGIELNNLRKLVEKLSLLDRVVFLGRISNDSVPEFLSRMYIYVALSRSDSESFGVAVVEAMSCGVPVVVSDADGFKEVVPNGVAGYVVPKNNAELAAERIMQLLSDKELVKKMGEAGRRHVIENYTWSSSVDKMIDVYDSIL